MKKNKGMGKYLRCKLCNQDIWLPENKVGGYWHLNGWGNSHGKKFTGGYCSGCFNKLHNIKE